MRILAGVQTNSYRQSLHDFDERLGASTSLATMTRTVSWSRAIAALRVSCCRRLIVFSGHPVRV